jgi:hypothetical protein
MKYDLQSDPGELTNLTWIPGIVKPAPDCNSGWRNE